MKCYRIMSDSYYKSPYGCSANAGRWNPRGTRMIYAGSAPTVALLEYLCIKGPAVGSRPWYMIVYEITDESLIGTLETKGLPPDWAVIPHGKATQDFGKSWLDAREFPFLRVPSARINISFYPMECNLLINPDFPGLTSLLKVVDTIPFTYLLDPWTGPLKKK
jgi:RES domain-containing protein